MTDRITATLAVIEAAKEWHNVEMMDGVYPDPHPVTSTDYASNALMAATQALADATSPDLDVKIAEVLPCDWPNSCGLDHHLPTCFAAKRPAVRDLIVALLADERDNAIGVSKLSRQDGFDQGFEQAREQAAKIADHLIIAAPKIRAMKPISTAVRSAAARLRLTPARRP